MTTKVTSDLVEVAKPYSAAYLQTLSEIKAGEPVSVFRFIPSNLHSGIKAGTDTTDLSSYLQAALDGIASEKATTLTLSSRGSSAMRRLHLGGSVFHIGSKLTVDDTLHLAIEGGAIKALSTFPTSDWMLEIGGTTHCEGIELRNIVFDSNYRARGGIAADDFFRLWFERLHLVRYKTHGIFTGDISTVTPNSISHEAVISKCFLVELPADDTGFTDSSNRVAVGIYSGNPDNFIAENVVFWSSRNLELGRGGTLVRGNHFYAGPDSPTPIGNTNNINIYIQGSNTQNISILENYIDNGNIVINQFNSIQVENNMFYTNTANTGFHFIELKPSVTNQWARNFNIVNNRFRSVTATVVGIYEDTAAGNIQRLKDSAIKNNTSDYVSGNYVTLKSSEVRGSISVSAVSTFTIDRSSDLIGSLDNGKIVMTPVVSGTHPALTIGSIASNVVNGEASVSFTGGIRYELSTEEPVV